MKKLIGKIKIILRAGKKAPRKIKPKTTAQSMVEFAVLLPLLLILFTGMVEFGFMLNSYLALLDATRAAARQYSNTNPYKIVGSAVVYDENFGADVAQAVIDNLAPPTDTSARRINLDSGRDDILVSVIGIKVTDTTTTPYTASVLRDTTKAGAASEFYSQFNNYIDPAATANDTPPGHTTKYSDQNIIGFLGTNGANPVNNGLLIVELYYGYPGTLNLPWVQLFASPTNPVMLYSSTIMPLVAVRPD